MTRSITRRRFVGLGLAGAATVFLGPDLAWPADGTTARLKARPRKPAQPVKPGIQNLGLAKGKDGILSVPPGYDAKKPVPLILMRHGALGRTEGFNNFSRIAAEFGIATLVPDSRGRTWDLVLGGFGPDVVFIDRALEHAFARVAVDPRHLAIAGFSDGASYALSLGLPNGDLFTHVMPFSPGFMLPPGRQGKPPVWISHGTGDSILPVESSRERIVPQLKQWGYKVHYKEFNGGHELTPDLAREAFRWFIA